MHLCFEIHEKNINSKIKLSNKNETMFECFLIISEYSSESKFHFTLVRSNHFLSAYPSGKKTTQVMKRVEGCYCEWPANWNEVTVGL